MTIAIRHETTGELQFVGSRIGYGPGWRQHGPALPDDLPLTTAELVAGAWVESPTRVEAALIAAIKGDAERRKMAVRSPGSGKGAEYREKRAEAYAASSVVASVLDALTSPAAVQQYPAAAMEAQLTGEKLSAVLKRYLAAANAADMEVYRVSAIEQRATVAIKAAGTAAAKRAAAAALDWTWRPAA